MFLEIYIDRRRKNPYAYGLFRETFRDGGRVRHRTRGRVTGLSLGELEALRDFVRRGCPKDSGDGCVVKHSREFGAACAVLQMAESLGLERLKGIRQETVVFNDTEVTLKTTPDDEQQRIIDLLVVQL
jgi:hypothetical protein